MGSLQAMNKNQQYVEWFGIALILKRFLQVIEWEKVMYENFGGMQMFEREPKQTVDIVYTKHDLLTKLQELRKSPETVQRNMIYILTKHVNEFHALNRDSQIKLVTSHGVRSFLKELLFKESPIENALRRMNLSHGERQEYEAVIHSGGMLIVSGTDPFHEEEWTGHTLTKWITNRSNSSNIILWDVKEERVIPFESKPQLYFLPSMGVAGEFGHGEEVMASADDEVPLKENQRLVRDPKTRELGVYQGPHH